MYDYTRNDDGSYTLTNVRTDGAVAGPETATVAGPETATVAGTPVNLAGMTGYAVGSGANTVVWIGGANTRGVWNAAIEAGRPVRVSGMPGGDRLIFLDSSEINGLSDLAAFATLEGSAYQFSWVVDADDTPNFCQIDDGSGGTDDLSLSECATRARFDVGVFTQPARIWSLGQIDALFDPA